MAAAAARATESQGGVARSGREAEIDVHAELTTPASAAGVFRWVDDLARYPLWMPLVHAVEPCEPDADERPAWRVELRRHIGPLTRSKRLRMVRARHEPFELVVFERAERDGRTHAPWVLSATLDAIHDSTRLRIDLHYGGGLWTGGLLERALREDIGRGRQTLSALLEASPTQ